MAQLIVSEIINAPVEKVWLLVSDIMKHAAWSPKTYTAELVSGENGAVGSKYRSAGFIPPAEKNHANDVEITEVVPRSKFVFRASDSNGNYINTFNLESVGGGTKVTFQLDFPQMGGIARILLPLALKTFGKKDATTRLGLLKAQAEGK